MGSPTATAPWKQLLLNALQSNSSLKHSSFFQLATVGSSGRPSNRTVVFRGFQENTDKIQIHTDSRSRKIEELKHNPLAEICWYFADSWEQFRISGTVEMIDHSNPDSLKLQQREKAWHACSVKSRLQYLGPTPGLPTISEHFTDENSLDSSTGPVDSFCLLILDPDQVDYLNLKSNQRMTFTSTKNDSEEKFYTEKMVNSERFQWCFSLTPTFLEKQADAGACILWHGERLKKLEAYLATFRLLCHLEEHLLRGPKKSALLLLEEGIKKAVCETMFRQGSVIENLDASNDIQFGLT